MADLISQPYRVPRLRLAYIAIEEYLRTFWFFVISIPMGGVAMLIIGERTTQALGFVAILWPLSLPARALAVSGRAAKLFANGATMRLTEEGFEFIGTEPLRSGKRARLEIPIASIRDVVRRQGMLVVRTRNFAIAPIEPTSIDEVMLPRILNAGKPDATPSTTET